MAGTLPARPPSSGPPRTPDAHTLPGIGRRLAPGRRAVRADVLVSPLDHDLPPFWAKAEELSHGGMFIRTRRLPREGALLMLELVFPELPIPKLRLDAHVVHRIPGAGFGCSFVSVPARIASRLSEIVAYVSAAPLSQRR